MQNRLFQNTLTQLKKDIKRVMGVIDDTETVIACSDENVIDEHLRMLADEPQMLELYREISENIHRLAIR